LTSSPRQTPPATRSRGARPLRSAPRKPFLERNRGRLLWGIAGLAVVLLGTMAFLNATSPAYACTTQWEPAVTPPPAPSATPRLGYVQDDFGREHVTIGSFVRYALCPPASGKHYNIQGEGPIRPQVYGPDDNILPEGWIHNLEHGGLVVLYRCEESDPGCTEGSQQAFRDFSATFPTSPICGIPAGNISPVIARFDQMAWPYAALLWGQVLPMDTFDGQLVRDFFAQQGERSNPEQLCTKPTPTPAPTGTPGASGTPAASGSPAASAAPTATPAASAAPTAPPAAS
jgi:hypothetical protein